MTSNSCTAKKKISEKCRCSHIRMMEFLVWVKYFSLQLFILELNSGFECFFIRVQGSCRDVVSAPAMFVWLELNHAESHFSMHSDRSCKFCRGQTLYEIHAAQQNSRTGLNHGRHCERTLGVPTSSEWVPYSSFQRAVLIEEWAVKVELDLARWKVPRKAFVRMGF